MDKISRVAPPEAVSVSDGLYSFVVKLNEAPAGHWITCSGSCPIRRRARSTRTAWCSIDRERGLLFASEEPRVPQDKNL